MEPVDAAEYSDRFQTRHQDYVDSIPGSEKYLYFSLS
jgi:hypothetical protein